MPRTSLSTLVGRGDARSSALRAVAAGPHAPLALGAALLLVGESQGFDRTLAGPLVEGVVAGAALLLAWRRRLELRLTPILGLGLGFQLAWVAIHVKLGMHGDLDARAVYTTEGESLLHGTFPSSPYPAGAVGLFTAETWLGGGSASTSNALMMIPFQAIAVTALWALRTRWSTWVAAVVALWPLNVFFWDYRFDLVPAAAIAAGAALADRERWHAAGWVLGLGALAKWTPALSAVVLLAWLLASRRTWTAATHALGFAIPVALVNAPVFLLAPSAASSPYRAQSVRGITGESLPYLPLRALGLARPARHYYGVAHVPAWSSPLAAALQVLAVVAFVALGVRARASASALALAALAPAAFLLTNRVFSPQYFVVILVGCALAATLVERRPRELLAVVGVVGAATVANATLFPGLAGAATGWVWVSAAALVPAAIAVVWLTVRSVR